MSINSEISRLVSSKNDIKSAIEAKGVSVGTNDLISTYANKISQIETPDATIYSGTNVPSSSLGKNGDLYIKI